MHNNDIMRVVAMKIKLMNWLLLGSTFHHAALVMHAVATYFYLLTISVIYLCFTVEGELISSFALIFVTNVKLSDR